MLAFYSCHTIFLEYLRHQLGTNQVDQIRVRMSGFARSRHCGTSVKWQGGWRPWSAGALGLGLALSCLDPAFSGPTPNGRRTCRKAGSRTGTTLSCRRSGMGHANLAQAISGGTRSIRSKLPPSTVARQHKGLSTICPGLLDKLSSLNDILL